MAFASCSKTTPVYEQAGEIYLSPVSENVTKSMMTTNQFQGSAFKVWSWFNQAASQANAVSVFQAGFAIDAENPTTVYVDEKPFVQKNATADYWGGEVAYYWPNTGSLIFAGYHAPNLTDDQVNYIFNETQNTMVFSDVAQADVTASGYAEDIMYFNMTPSSYDNKSLSVGFEFNHALSWITVTLAKRTDPVIDAKITVESVEFTEISSVGTGVVEGSDAIVWTPTATPAPYDFLITPMVIDYDRTGGAVKTKIYTLKEQLFIPQGINGLINVKYTIESTDGAKFTEVYPINLTALKTGAHNVWSAGKHYTYNLSIGTDEILVTPSVDTWEGVPTDILIPLPDKIYP